MYFTMVSIHQLPGQGPAVDDALSDDIFTADAESSVTESDDNIVVVESDDPFFDDQKNANSKLSKKLEAEVRWFLPLTINYVISHWCSALLGLMTINPPKTGSIWRRS
jgi:hypothetical protein